MRSTAKFSTRIGGMDAEAQAKIDETMIALDGTPQQGTAGRQCDSRRIARHRQGRGRGQWPAALPLCRRHRRAHAAGADDEHHQWRGACRQSDRFPGIHDHAARRAVVRRGVAHRRGDFSHAARRAEGGRPQHQCGRRRRFCAEPALGRCRARLRRQGGRESGLQARHRRRARARLRRDRILQGRRLPLRRRGQNAIERKSRRNISPTWSRAIPSCRSKTAWPKTTSKAGKFSPISSARNASWSATICS